MPRKRAQAHAKAGRRRDSRADRQDPRHRRCRWASTGRSMWPILGSDPEGLARIATDFAEKVKKIPGIVDVDLVGQARPAGLRGAAEARRGARARAHRAAAGVVAARLRERRGRHLLDHARRRAGRGAAAPARDAARARRPDAHAAGGVLPRTARRSRSTAVADDRAGDQPRRDPPPEPAAPRGHLRRRARAARRATSASDVQKLVKDTQLPPGYSFDVGGAHQGAGRSVRRHAGRDGAGGDLHLHRAGQPVRQLPAADRDHGLAAAVADRRDAGAAVLALAR